MSKASPAVAVVIAAVVVALLPMPYGYYSAMRWVVSGACAFLAVREHQAGRSGWTWVWAVAAGVYNPIFPVNADRGVWSVINLATIGLAAYYSAQTRRRA